MLTKNACGVVACHNLKRLKEILILRDEIKKISIKKFVTERFLDIKLKAQNKLGDFLGFIVNYVIKLEISKFDL